MPNSALTSFIASPLGMVSANERDRTAKQFLASQAANKLLLKSMGEDMVTRIRRGEIIPPQPDHPAYFQNALPNPNFGAAPLPKNWQTNLMQREQLPPNASPELHQALVRRAGLKVSRMMSHLAGRESNGMELWEAEQELDRYIQSLTPEEANYYYFGVK